MKNVTRLFDFPYFQLENYNLPDALVTKNGTDWIKTSTQEYINKANALSRALLHLGVEKNDYEKIKKNFEELAEEIIAKALHPKRIFRLIEEYGEDEIYNIYLIFCTLQY